MVGGIGKLQTPMVTALKMRRLSIWLVGLYLVAQIWAVVPCQSLEAASGTLAVSESHHRGALRLNFGSPEGRFFRHTHGGGLVAPW